RHFPLADGIHCGRLLIGRRGVWGKRGLAAGVEPALPGHRRLGLLPLNDANLFATAYTSSNAVAIAGVAAGVVTGATGVDCLAAAILLAAVALPAADVTDGAFTAGAATPCGRPPTQRS